MALGLLFDEGRRVQIFKKKTHKKQVSDNKNESQNLIGGYEVRLNHYLDLYNA